MDHLYFIQSYRTGMIKIGRSKNPKRRLKQLQTGSPDELRIIHVFNGLGWREKEIHIALADWKIRENGEWFSYKCVGSIPIEFYQQISYGAFDSWWVNS